MIECIFQHIQCHARARLRMMRTADEHLKDEARAMGVESHLPAEQRLDDCRADRHDGYRFDEHAELDELHELAYTDC